jgi:DNA primase
VIPSNFVQDLLARADIVHIVGRHVQLKKSGANHLGLCPFHGEKTASFTVNASRQTYHCFGCGVHGNAVSFLIDYCGFGFVEAVQDLAQQVGMTVPQDNRSAQERAQAAQSKARQTTLTEVLGQASEHYRKQLKNAPHAVAYLQKRGLTGEVASLFGLGYSSPGWRNLASAFPDYDDPLLEESGLVIHQGEANTNEQKRYDRFRDRIMFPIRSVLGEVIGFGGRVLDQGEPKYLNSPETAVFVKGRELYGLHEARVGLRKRGYALVVEGYMDVVALAQLGFPNAVATLGTACSTEHLQKLFRFTEAVVFSFDGDTAGRRAADRALQASLPHASDTRSIKFLFLPPEHDPDSFVREFGAESFERCIEQAVPLSRQLIETARSGCDTQTAEGRAKLLANAKPLWQALPEGVLKIQLLSELAACANLQAEDLSRLWLAPQALASTKNRTVLHQRGVTRRESNHRVRSAPMSQADSVLRMVLLHGQWWEQISAEDHELLFALPQPHGELFTWLERYLHEHGVPSWAVWCEAIKETPWSDWVTRLVPASALEDEMNAADLRRVLDSMWVKRLETEQKSLIDLAAQDPSALVKWREVDAHMRRRLASLTLPSLT